MAFYESDECRPYREGRIAGCINEFLLVSGEDAAGAAHIADRAAARRFIRRQAAVDELRAPAASPSKRGTRAL